jgi:murein DD-endopeptidase MepM/ murein hydrolase activator NlpD
LANQWFSHKKFRRNKKGIDISGQAGQSVVAVGDGTVLYANNMRGYGNLVIIDHADGVFQHMRINHWIG